MSATTLKRLVLLACLGVFAALPAFAAGAPELTPAAAADTTGQDWSRVSEYRIVPGDRLGIDFGQRLDNLSENIHECTVRPDGRITVYPVGDVVAAGLTPMELQKSLTALLAADLRSPRVTVELVTAAGNVVHVIGRVERPGNVPATPFVTVLQAISEAGGFKDDAARNSVIVMHRDGARTLSVQRVRCDRLLKGEDFADIVLGRFDIVFVPRSSIGNLDLFVHQFFGETSPAVSTALAGWELFNLDRVFVTRVVKE